MKEEQRGLEEREGLIRRLQAQLRDAADDSAIRDRRQKAEIEALTKVGLARGAFCYVEVRPASARSALDRVDQHR